MDPQMLPESPAYRAWREEIEARGEAHALLLVLKARQFPIDEATQARVLGCTDKATLERWIVRAATATSLDQVFSED